MAGTETITLRLVAQDLMSGNVSKAIGSLDRLAKRGGLVGSVLQGVGQSMGQLINPVALVANGIGMVTDALGDAQTAYREDQASQAKLKAALEANIEAWDGNTKAIEDTIAARMKLGFSDDEQRASLALLVSQVEDVNDALAIQRTAMDLARLKNMNLADASTVLAKAYLGSGTALQKMGIKLKKGTDGMDAIAAVQQRAAGQAEAWSKTSVGAAEAFDVKVGELQEKIGEFVDGASQQFIGFLSGIVDVIDGPDGASANIRDLTGTIVKLRTEADALSRSGPFEALANDLAGWNQQLKQAEELYSQSTWFQWMQRLGPDTLRNFGKASAETFADVQALATGVIEAGGSFEEFASIVRQKIAPSFNVLTSTWGAATGEIEAQTEAAALTMKGALSGMRAAVRSSINGSLATMADMKGPWKDAWKEYAEYAKDPFKPKAFENWLKRRSEKATEKAREAAKDGKPQVAQRWRELAKAMSDPVIIALTQINGSVIESMGIIALFKQQTKGLNNILPAIGSVFGNDRDGRGGTGGNGFGATPYSLPAGGSGMGSGGHVNVNVTHIGSMSEADGQRFARTVAPHISRELGRAGR